MKKVLIYVVGVIVLLIVGFFLLNNYIYTEKQGENGFVNEDLSNFQNLTYVIDGLEVDLNNGTAQTQTATSTITTSYVGHEVEGDLSEDGISDIAFVVSHTQEGAPAAYYLLAAVQTDAGYKAIQGGLIGEDIVVQETRSEAGRVIINYDRPRTSGTSTQMQSVSRAFAVIEDQLVSVPE